LLSDNPDAASAFLDRIWPYIESHVNRIVPQHSRLIRPLVLVARRSKPFYFSDKGTIKTKESLAVYQAEIDKAYKGLDTGLINASHLPDFPIDAQEDAVASFVGRVIRSALGRDVPMDVDFFRLGMDSLMATRLRADISAALRRACFPHALSKEIIYTYPSVRELSRHLVAFVRPDVAVSKSSQGCKSTEIAIHSLISDLTKDLPSHRAQQPASTCKNYVITGTTGSLGATFLDYLIRHMGDSDRVFLLNRRNPTYSVLQRHRQTFSDKGLDFAPLDKALLLGRAVFVDVNFNEPRLGIDDDDYEEVCIPS
jgi:hypothetical protein